MLLRPLGSSVPTLFKIRATKPPTTTTPTRGCCFYRLLHTTTPFATLITDQEFCSRQLQGCVRPASLHHCRAIHAPLIKTSAIPSSLFLHNHLLNAYLRCGDLVRGHQLFDEMPHPNAVSWSILINGFAQRTDNPQSQEEALLLFRRMHAGGSMPSEYTFVRGLNACSFSRHLPLARQIYALVIRSGFESNTYLMNAFLTALIRHREWDEASAVFEGSLHRDTVSWNAMMAGYLQPVTCSKVPGFWCRMNKEGLKPDNFTFASVLSALAALSDMGMGTQAHAQLVKSGHGIEVRLGNSLIALYLKGERLVDGFKVFEGMPQRDEASWTHMAAGCLRCGEPAMALEVIAEMKSVGIEFNTSSLATTANACGILGSLEEGKKAHGLRIKLGNNAADVGVDNALIDMYWKCGSIEGAVGVFQSVTDRSVVSWTTMIMGYAQNGHARMAIEVFEAMRREDLVEPNCLTFICVLYACSQGGFVDEGLKYFSLMATDHGIFPGEDHYACMVDILGRGGRIKEAEKLILSMPFQPSALTWKILLGSCEVHQDTETALRAAKQIVDIEKKDPSTYVLLADMLGGERNWGKVEEALRELMETGDAGKITGSSWIQFNHKPPTATFGNWKISLNGGIH